MLLLGSLFSSCDIEFNCYRRVDRLENPNPSKKEGVHLLDTVLLEGTIRYLQYKHFTIHREHLDRFVKFIFLELINRKWVAKSTVMQTLLSKMFKQVLQVLFFLTLSLLDLCAMSKA